MFKRVLKDFKQIFKPQSPLEKAHKEVTEARLRLLEAHTGLEWAKVNVEYNTLRIKRLSEYIHQEEEKAKLHRAKKTIVSNNQQS